MLLPRCPALLTIEPDGFPSPIKPGVVGFDYHEVLDGGRYEREVLITFADVKEPDIDALMDLARGSAIITIEILLPRPQHGTLRQFEHLRFLDMPVLDLGYEYDPVLERDVRTILCRCRFEMRES